MHIYSPYTGIYVPYMHIYTRIRTIYARICTINARGEIHFLGSRVQGLGFDLSSKCCQSAQSTITEGVAFNVIWRPGGAFSADFTEIFCKDSSRPNENMCTIIDALPQGDAPTTFTHKVATKKLPQISSHPNLYNNRHHRAVSLDPGRPPAANHHAHHDEARHCRGRGRRQASGTDNTYQGRRPFYRRRPLRGEFGSASDTLCTGSHR